MSTEAILVREWEDAPEDGRSADEWPFPTTHRKFHITGDLADRIRARLGVEQEHPVFLTEDVESGGYSEYTQEDSMFFTIECHSHEVHFDEWSPRVDFGATTIARCEAWLNEAGAVL